MFLHSGSSVYDWTYGLSLALVEARNSGCLLCCPILVWPPASCEASCLAICVCTTSKHVPSRILLVDHGLEKGTPGDTSFAFGSLIRFILRLWLGYCWSVPSSGRRVIVDPLYWMARAKTARWNTTYMNCPGVEQEGRASVGYVFAMFFMSIVLHSIYGEFQYSPRPLSWYLPRNMPPDFFGRS